MPPAGRIFPWRQGFGIPGRRYARRQPYAQLSHALLGREHQHAMRNEGPFSPPSDVIEPTVGRQPISNRIHPRMTSACVVDVGLGNVASVINMLDRLGHPAKITYQPDWAD